MRKISTEYKGRPDVYMLLENGDLLEAVERNASRLRSKIIYDSSWTGATYDEFNRKVRTGDEELVAESEALLTKIEDQVPMSRGWRNIDDVVGAIPNVPSFLAGHPQCMRRRERTMRETAPLAIYMDLTSSGGIHQSDVRKRGIALLALTRCLVEHRPVELWVGASLNKGNGSGTVMWRIDTAPLDLARSAFHIGATVMSRGFGYEMTHIEFNTGGHWPFNDFELHKQTAKERLAQVFPGTEILYIPPIYISDDLVKDPVGWIKRTLAQYVQKED